MTPRPHELWEQARSEHHNAEARGRRYVQLMREAGLIVPREPGDDTPMTLECGWRPTRSEYKEIAAHEAADAEGREGLSD